MDGVVPARPLPTRDAVVDLALVVGRMHVALNAVEAALAASLALGAASAAGNSVAVEDAIAQMRVAMERIERESATSWANLETLMRAMGGDA